MIFADFEVLLCNYLLLFGHNGVLTEHVSTAVWLYTHMKPVCCFYLTCAFEMLVELTH